MNLSLLIQPHVIYYMNSATANGAINRNIDRLYRWMLLHGQMLYLCISELFDLNDISNF